MLVNTVKVYNTKEKDIPRCGATVNDKDCVGCSDRKIDFSPNFCIIRIHMTICPESASLPQAQK
jgi:hypothetical protein